MKKYVSVLLAIFLIVAVSFGGCASGPSDRQEVASDSPVSMEEEGAALAKESDPTPVLPFIGEEQGKQVIYQVALQLQTEEFREGVRFLIDTVETMDGYVESATVHGRSLRELTQERTARYTVRIPVQHFADFLVLMEDNYNLLYMEQISQDVTTASSSVSQELEVLREKEKEILEQIKETDDPEEEELLRDSLSAIRQQIKERETDQSAIQEAVQYSTAVVEINEVLLPDALAQLKKDQTDLQRQDEASFGQRLKDRLGDSGNRLVRFGENLLFLLIALVPFLLLAALFYFLYHQFKKTTLYTNLKSFFRKPPPAGPPSPPQPPTSPQ